MGIRMRKIEVPEGKNKETGRKPIFLEIRTESI